MLECDGFVRWIMRPDVADARLGTPRIYYQFKGKKHRYTADLTVIFVNGSPRRPLVIEFKPKAVYLADASLREKLDHLSIEFDRLGQDLAIETEEDVYTSDLPEKRFIFRYYNEAPSRFDDEIVAQVRSMGAVLVEQLLSMFFSLRAEQLALVPCIWRLVARKELFVDFAQTVDSSATIFAKPPSAAP